MNSESRCCPNESGSIPQNYRLGPRMVPKFSAEGRREWGFEGLRLEA